MTARPCAVATLVLAGVLTCSVSLAQVSLNARPKALPYINFLSKDQLLAQKTTYYGDGNRWSGFYGEVESQVFRSDEYPNKLIFAYRIRQKGDGHILSRASIDGWDRPRSGRFEATGAQTEPRFSFTTPLATADRLTDNVLGFSFSGSHPLFGSGTTSTYFLIFTEAEHYHDSNMYLLGGALGQASVYAPVPEPGTMLLLGGGLAALAWRRRRRANQA